MKKKKYNKNKSNDWNQVLDDADYLCDELNALKKVIVVVPYRERPFEEASVLDMITKIDYLQTRFYIPFFEYLASEKNKSLSLSLRDFDNDFTPGHWDHRSFNDIIDQIIANRKRLIDLIGNIEPISGACTWIIDGELKNVLDVVTGLVDMDRRQLKLVSERVLSIDLERNSD